MPTTPATVAAAQLLLRELGVTPDQLDWIPVDAPTIADYLPHVIAAAGPGAQRTYGTYWNRILTACGSRRLDEVRTSDIEALMRTAVATRRH
ncbi:MAG TPA: site-specific integrase, partial [Kutzneria sp.]